MNKFKVMAARRVLREIIPQECEPSYSPVSNLITLSVEGVLQAQQITVVMYDLNTLLKDFQLFVKYFHAEELYASSDVLAIRIGRPISKEEAVEAVEGAGDWEEL